MSLIHEIVTNVAHDRETVEITVIGPTPKSGDVYLLIEAPVAGSPSTSFHVSRDTAAKLGEVLIRAAKAAP